MLITVKSPVIISPASSSPVARTKVPSLILTVAHQLIASQSSAHFGSIASPSSQTPESFNRRIILSVGAYSEYDLREDSALKLTDSYLARILGFSHSPIVVPPRYSNVNGVRDLSTRIVSGLTIGINCWVTALVLLKPIIADLP